MNRTTTNAIASTHATIRSVSVIESVNPARNGRASRGSIVCRNDESLRMLDAPPSPPPASAASTGWLAGFARTAGSASAAWKAGVPAAARNCSAMLPVTVLNTMDRKIAVPSVPPSWRKNVDDPVATPMSRGGTAFCTASTSVCMQEPRPRPNIAM